MNREEHHSTILLVEPTDWEKTEVQGLEPASSESLEPPAPSRFGYYIAGLVAIGALLVWVFK